MTSYTKDEIISSTILGRNIGTVLSRLRDKKLRKVAVIRNNELEAVMLPIEEYERITDLSEHIEIANIIRQREKTPLNESIGFEKILKEQGLNEADL
ncbi:MAG: hypothetical protein V1779_11950 [bacterium]